MTGELHCETKTEVGVVKATPPPPLQKARIAYDLVTSQGSQTGYAFVVLLHVLAGEGYFFRVTPACVCAFVQIRKRRYSLWVEEW